MMPKSKKELLLDAVSIELAVMAEQRNLEKEGKDASKAKRFLKELKFWRNELRENHDITKMSIWLYRLITEISNWIMISL